MEGQLMTYDKLLIACRRQAFLVSVFFFAMATYDVDTMFSVQCFEYQRNVTSVRCLRVLFCVDLKCCWHKSDCCAVL